MDVTQFTHKHRLTSKKTKNKKKQYDTFSIRLKCGVQFIQSRFFKERDECKDNENYIELCVKQMK